MILRPLLSAPRSSLPDLSLNAADARALLIRQRSGQVCSSSAAELPELRSRGGGGAQWRQQGSKNKKSSRSARSRGPSSGLPYHVPSSAEQFVDLQAWNAPKVDAMAWTAMIMDSRDPPQLHRCLSGLHSLSNKYHLTAAIDKLASFGRGAHRQSALLMVPFLLLRVKESLPHLPTRSLLRPLVSISHLLGTYEIKDKELMTLVAKGVESNFHELTTQGLTNLLWGFARLNMHPSQRWMEPYLAACQVKLAQFKAQEMSVLLWSLAKLKFRLAPTVLKNLLQHVSTHLDSYNPQSISNVLWSLGVFNHRPEDAWLETVTQEMMQPAKLWEFTNQGLSQGLWALAQLKYQPKEEFKRCMSEHIRLRILGNSRCNSIDLATFMYACACMSLPLDTHMIDRLLVCSVEEMKSMQPSHLAKTIWSFAKMGVTPPSSWLNKLLSASYQLLDTFNTRDLAMFAWGMAKLKLSPPRTFLLPLVHRIEILAAEFPPQEVANTLWALARFHVRPSSVLLAQFFEATDMRLSSFKPGELSQMIWALADRHCALDAPWLQEFLKVSFLRMPEFTRQGLGNLIWALCQLRTPLPPAWLYSYVKVSHALLSAGQLRAQDLGVMINALSAMNSERPLQKVSDFLLDAMDALSCMEMESQAYTRHQLQRLQGLTAPALRPGGGGGVAAQAAAAAAAEEQPSSPAPAEQQQLQGEEAMQVEVAEAEAGPAAHQAEVDVQLLREYFSKMSKVQSMVQAVQVEAVRRKSGSKASGHASGNSTKGGSMAAYVWKGVKGAEQRKQEQQQQEKQKQRQQFGTLTIQMSSEMQIEMPDLYAELSNGNAMSLHTSSSSGSSRSSSGSNGCGNSSSSSSSSSRNEAGIHAEARSAPEEVLVSKDLVGTAG